MKKIATIVLLSLVYAVLGTIINIPADYSTITEGISFAVNTDTVLVAPDTYIENLNFNGKDIVLASHFLTTGDSTYIGETIIDGNANGNVIVFNNGETENAKLIGFTITNGYSNIGSGIYINGSSPEISNNVIKDNEIGWYGVGCGLYLKHSSSTIENNIIRNNDGAMAGCGIRLDSCSVVNIQGNIISDHITNSGYGIAGSSGISIGNSTSILLENNLMYDNYVDFGHGDMIGVGSTSSGVVIKNCTFYNQYNSWALFVLNGDVKILNSIIWSSNDYQGATFYENDSLNVRYSNVKDAYYGEGNISIDPMFDNLETFDLQLQSPCINRGDPTSGLDPDGTIADMGWRSYDLSGCGTVSGTVTLDSGLGTMENVWITSDGNNCYPLSSGEYSLNLIPGTYSITANLGVSSSQTLDGINVLLNEVTENVDFHLTNSDYGGIINVAKDDSGDFKIIQDAINVCFEGDTIIVNDGIYNEALLISNKSFNLSSKFLLDGDSIHIENTIIDGKNEFRPLYIEDIVDTNLVITGLIIQNGYNYSRGGGIYIRYSSPLFDHCIIQNNITDYKGGGVYNHFSSSVFENCIIRNNDAGTGGGINCYYSDLSITNSDLSNNSAYNGGFLYTYNSNTDIRHSIISNNAAGRYGAISNSAGFELILKNCKISGNSAEIFGIIDIGGNGSLGLISNSLICDNYSDSYGVIVCGYEDNYILMNNTIVNNGEGALYISSSSPLLYNNIFWNNSQTDSSQICIYGNDSNPNFYNCLVQYGEEGFYYSHEATPETNTGAYMNNLDSDPLFLDEWNGDFFLTENSPCIDTGTEAIPDSIQFYEFDLAGNSRIYGSTIDMGAYEWQGSSIDNGQWTMDNYELEQNYPNPFNPKTTINFSVAHNNSEIKLMVYNVNGQVVNTLVDGIKNTGKYSVTFDASNLNSGVYYYSLEVNGVKEATKRMVMIK